MIHQDIASLSKPITSFLPDPDNARKHDPKNLAAIKASLAKFGQRKPIVCQQTDSGLIVRAGNGTLEAAKELGWSDLAAVVITEDNVTATGYAIADNRTAELAEWDLGVLDETLFSLAADGVDLLDLGFSEEDLAKILPKEIEAVEGEDDVPEVVEMVCKPGDLWLLGEHRLLCGDSTDVLQVERLMNGQKADMVFTDPPYGLGGYGGRNNMALMGDEKDPTGFYHAVPIDVPEVYVWGRVENWDHINFTPRDVIVWRKNNFGLGRGYRGQYEVCFYKGAFDGSDSDVWDVPKYEHPTQKPVALAERAITNSNPKIVLDIFLGSGSTLIACEKTQRKCFGCEIDPHYCDIIIARYEKFTGKKATLEVANA